MSAVESSLRIQWIENGLVIRYQHETDGWQERFFTNLAGFLSWIEASFDLHRSSIVAEGEFFRATAYFMGAWHSILFETYNQAADWLKSNVGA